MSTKHYISAQDLLEDSFRLAAEILKDGYRPTFIIAVWRGGAPVGIAVQEMLSFFGIETNHIAIRTSSYTGIGQQSSTVGIHGLNYVIKNITHDDALLIVDDVFDTGVTINAVIELLLRRTRKNAPREIRVGVPWYKPDNNKTQRIPEYYVRTSDRWLVFPHELDGLSSDEIAVNRPAANAIVGFVRNAAGAPTKRS